MDSSTINVEIDGILPLPEQLRSCVRKLADEFSKKLELDLSELEAITIAADLGSSMAKLDLGFGTREKVEPTKGTNNAVGVSPEVLRGEELRTHVFLPSSIASQLLESAGTETAKYVLAHELSHVDEHVKASRSMSQEIIKLHLTPKRFKVGDRAIWGDYYASRKAASIHPEMESVMEQMFCRAYSDLGSAISGIQRKFLALTEQEKAAARSAVENLTIGVFIHFGRLIGHLDGLGQSLSEGAPLATKLLCQNPGHAECFNKVHATLQRLWRNFPGWKSLDELDSVFEDLRSFLKLF